MIIVIVPMIAVALVLFSITADSETGKADAQIAQGLRAAFAIYDQDRGQARPALARALRDNVLAGALARGDRKTVAARVPKLAAQLPGVRRIAVYDANRRPIAAAGRPDAVAPAAAAPAGGGRPLGHVAGSTTPARELARRGQRGRGPQARSAGGPP